MSSLTRLEAEARSALLAVTAYSVDLDIAGADSPDQASCTSRSSVVFTAVPGASTFLDVRAVEVTSVDLNGASIDPATIRDGRLELSGLRSDNTVVVEATMGYSNDGQGL